jgi:hypothetical protein
MDYPETSGNLRKPAAEASGRFPDFSINKKNHEKKYTNKKFRRLVSGGFQRFPDNPSLTDHTVCKYFLTKKGLTILFFTLNLNLRPLFKPYV